jgi:hypothetical protein
MKKYLGLLLVMFCMATIVQVEAQDVMSKAESHLSPHAKSVYYDIGKQVSVPTYEVRVPEQQVVSHYQPVVYNYNQSIPVNTHTVTQSVGIGGRDNLTSTVINANGNQFIANFLEWREKDAAGYTHTYRQGNLRIIDRQVSRIW